ncbi:MAG: iron ABC transporter substrate-binding protein [SAR202 cluster bacterium]|nr:iron ABC transporter substrate-binding protein [SAR202 cluster bacterium]
MARHGISRWFGALAMAAIIGALVAGCGGQESGPPTLTIYSGRSESLVGPIITQFSAVTGVKVSVKYAGTPQLSATLLEEGKNTPADIFFAQDPGGLGAVESMLAPLTPQVLERVPEWARDSQGRWVGLSGRARTIVYNSQKLSKKDLPDDIYDLTRPEWRGRVGWAPTNASFQTMVTAMRVLWGEDKTLQWLQGMQANSPKTYSGNGPAVVAVADGEVDVALVNHYYIYPLLAERGPSFPVRNYHPKAGGPGALVMVAGAGVLQTSKNQANAEKFLEFMLSPVAQQFFAAQTYEYPLVDGVKVHPDLTPLKDIKSPAIGLAQLADLKGTEALLRRANVIP